MNIWHNKRLPGQTTDLRCSCLLLSACSNGDSNDQPTSRPSLITVTSYNVGPRTEFCALYQ